MRASVVVVGAGISGLAAAWELTGGAAGPTPETPRVEIIEASERVGGSLATTTFVDATIDLGPDGFLARRPEAVTLVHELGLDDELVPIAASGASIFLDGATHPLPDGLVLGVPVSLDQVRAVKGLSWRARLDARRDLTCPRRLVVGDDATIGDILRTKLGRELSYRFIEPMIGGIQAGRIDTLSAKSVAPFLLDAAREGGSLMRALRARTEPTSTPPSSEAPSPLFYSLRGGLGSLPRLLTTRLLERGVVVRHGVAVTALRRTPSGNYPFEVDAAVTTTPSNAVIVSTPAQVTGALLGRYHPDLAALEQIDSAGAAMITLALEATTLPPGTGVLVPLHTPWRGEGSLMVTALTFLDRKWPHLACDGLSLVRAHVGRIDDARWMSMSDEELVARVEAELDVLVPGRGPSRATLVQRWPASLPQYYLGHDQLVARARAAANGLGVHLAGMTYDGVGVPASIGSGRRAGREVLAALAGAPVG